MYLSCTVKAFLLFVDQGDTVYATVVPELDERELEKTIHPIVQEYFEHGDTKEVQVSRSWSANRASQPETHLHQVHYTTFKIQGSARINEEA